MSDLIHPTAVIAPGAQIDPSVSIGPYTVIGPHVRIGAGTTVGPHCVIEGHTTIGRDNRIFQFASLGAIPQDKKYAGEPCELVMGDRNTIREFTTFNIGSPGGGGVTRIGHDNWLMAYVHIAHDCIVGNHTIFANNSQLAGHVHVADWAILGGFTVVHQFVRIGAHSMCAMGAILFKDLPPYVTCSGNPAAPHGINSEGLKRRAYSPGQIENVRRAYKTLYKGGLLLEEARRELAALGALHSEVEVLSDFVAASTRGIMR